MLTANKKTVAKKSSARTSKKQVEEESEVDEEETSADVPDDDDLDDNDDEQDDGAGDADVAVFKVGDKVVNCAGLRGLVRQCHDNGTYCVYYNDGRKDDNLQVRQIKAVAAGKILIILYTLYKDVV